MSQIKEQNQILEKKLNKIGTTNPLEAELQTLFVRMLNGLSENFNKKIKMEHKKKPVKNEEYRTSGQDGGISRYTLPPCTTKTRTTTHLKTKRTRTDKKSNYLEVQQPRS